MNAVIPDRDEKVRAVVALVEGGMSEHKACAEVGINRGTFRAACSRVLSGDEYARALASLAHDQAEKLEQAIEDMRDGVIDAQMARVEIEARKWFASKFLPKRYGDKQILVGGDPDEGDKPVQVQAEVTVKFVRPGE